MQNGKMPMYLALSCDINKQYKRECLIKIRDVIHDVDKIMEKYFRVAWD